MCYHQMILSLLNLPLAWQRDFRLASSSGLMRVHFHTACFISAWLEIVTALVSFLPRIEGNLVATLAG